MAGEPDFDLRFDPSPSAMEREDFVARFGGIYEHSPWIAAAVWEAGLRPEHDNVAGLAAAMETALAGAGRDAKMALIRAHPDLAGRAAIAGDLTDASRTEQAGAGLDRCTPEEYARFQALNVAYKRKFGFPFILAVAGLNRGDILSAFEERIGNRPDAEFEEALRQVNRIAWLRLTALAAGEPSARLKPRGQAPR